MKHIFFIVAILSLTVFSLSAQPHSLGKLIIHSGYTMPVQPGYFPDYWKGIVNFGMDWDYPLSRNFSVNAGVQYHNFLFDDQKWSEDLSQFWYSQYGVEGDFIVSGALKSIVIGAIDVRFGLPVNANRLVPYVTAGMGVIYDDTDPLVVGGGVINFKTEFRPAYEMGAGLEWSVNDDFNLLIEGQYHHGLTRQENDQQIYLDLDKTYKKEEISSFISSLE